MDQAASLLAQGQVVAFPTETVYGLGANALDSGAVEAIFKAKGRPQDNPLIVHLGEQSQADKYVQAIPPKAACDGSGGPLTCLRRCRSRLWSRPGTVHLGPDHPRPGFCQFSPPQPTFRTPAPPGPTVLADLGGRICRLMREMLTGIDA